MRMLYVVMYETGRTTQALCARATQEAALKIVKSLRHNARPFVQGHDETDRQFLLETLSEYNLNPLTPCGKVRFYVDRTEFYDAP